MKHALLSAAALAVVSLTTLPAHASGMTPYQEMPAGTYVLEKTHASLNWNVSHLGLSNYAARFTRFDVTLEFNPKNPEASKLTATIDPTSVETDYPNAEEKDFDKKLSEGKEWFNSSEFPNITFTSTKIEKTGEHTGTVTGDLTFLGVTKPATLDVVFNGAMAEQPFSKKPTLGFSATGTIKRSEWGFSTYVPNIGDEVTIRIEAELMKAE